MCQHHAHQPHAQRSGVRFQTRSQWGKKSVATSTPKVAHLWGVNMSTNVQDAKAPTWQLDVHHCQLGHRNVIENSYQAQGLVNQLIK